MTTSPQTLVVLGCSATKFDVDGQVPAVHLYDGPVFRVLRSHLRTYKWPSDLSVGVLSAKYGFVGAVAPIKKYDQRMTPNRAAFLRQDVNESLSALVPQHKRVHLVLGRDYMQAIDSAALQSRAEVSFVEGQIGEKLHYFSKLLYGFSDKPRDQRVVSRSKRTRPPLYFLPDWDDFLDLDYDFRKDAFSAALRANRRQAHSIQLMRPQRLCDGVLVSLAQHLGTKGLLRRLPPSDPGLLRPPSVRDHFGLMQDQLAFGDCGAFSYSGQRVPVFSVEQAVAVYELYDFDLGASVDHIPLEEVVTEAGKREKLSIEERRRRVRLTKDNADAFLRVWEKRNCKFTPVGVIQGIDAKEYAGQVHEYIEMGYEHIALGGLVPQSDEAIREIVLAVNGELKGYRERPWIHLMGVFRPNLQQTFRSVGIDSFDSATYFRKAWLRSDQNYLSAGGRWYAALRVPPTSDPRTLARLKRSGKRESTIKRMEKDTLAALRKFDVGKLGLESCLSVVLRYDRLLGRGEFSSYSLREHYKQTLEERPWQKCRCKICRSIGIDVIIFRGYNRNKRRGAHNTLQLYDQLATSKPV
jgi:Queuine tRNA-ribosyltransferase